LVGKIEIADVFYKVGIRETRGFLLQGQIVLAKSRLRLFNKLDAFPDDLAQCGDPIRKGLQVGHFSTNRRWVIIVNGRLQVIEHVENRRRVSKEVLSCDAHVVQRSSL
jgi:hypothetical protein